MLPDVFAMPADGVCNQSRQTCKLDSISQDVGDRQIHLAISRIALMIEVIVFCEYSGNIIRLASIVED